MEVPGCWSSMLGSNSLCLKALHSSATAMQCAFTSHTQGDAWASQGPHLSLIT